MRIIELSDHPGQMLRQARQRCTAGDRQAQSRYEDTLARHQDRVAQAQSARDQARAGRRWLSWLLAPWQYAEPSGRPPWPTLAPQPHPIGNGP
jgi:hypothetical protein